MGRSLIGISMYSKLAFVLGYAAAQLTITDVSCDGVGHMTITYDWEPSNDADTLDRFSCADHVVSDAAQTDAAAYYASPLKFNPYNCKGFTTTNDLSSFNIPRNAEDPNAEDSKFTIHSTAKVGGETFNLKQFNIDVKCHFADSYDLVGAPNYTVTEDTEDVTFTTFQMVDGDFNLSLDKDDLAANEQLVATFTINTESDDTVAKWGKLSDDIQYAPTLCTVEEAGGTPFTILGGDAGACGYDQLLTELADVDAEENGRTKSGRKWTLAYQSFVMSNDGGTYTLKCTVSMCTKDNRDDADHACAKAFDCKNQ